MVSILVFAILTKCKIILTMDDAAEAGPEKGGTLRSTKGAGSRWRRKEIYRSTWESPLPRSGTIRANEKNICEKILLFLLKCIIIITNQQTLVFLYCDVYIPWQSHASA